MKAAIYCRLSEEDRNKQSETNDSISIQNQKSMLLSYAAEQGWDVYCIYSDDDYAGADRKRPEFNRLLADAEQHKFDIVLCKTQSRFTRELELVEKYIHGLFPSWGIRFISIVDNADTNNKGNKKSRQITGLVNEWYLEDMSDNIRSVLTNRRKNGLHIGSFALYGYKKDPERKGHLIIDEEAAEVVREVFTLFSKGFGKTAIARILNERGIPNPTEYKRLHGLRYQQSDRKNSTLWKYFAISNMLVNQIYIGSMVQGKYGSVSYKTKQNRPRPRNEWFIVENTHEAIIKRELWDRVQELIAQNAKPFTGGIIGLFARKARCAGCGYTMCSTKSRGKHYLQCSNRHVAKDACEGAFISTDALEQAVLTELSRLLSNYLDTDELEQKVDFSSDLCAQKEGLITKIAGYEKKISEYTNGIKLLYLDKARGILYENDLIELSEELIKEKRCIENTIKITRTQLDKIIKLMEAGNNQNKQLEQYKRIEHLNREMVEILIEYVSIGKRKPGTSKIPVTIYWKF